MTKARQSRTRRRRRTTIRGSPIGRTIAKRREVLGPGNKGRYGIVGLGAGSSACHKREGETWRFFEIDPLVIKIAKNPKTSPSSASASPTSISWSATRG